MSRAEFVRRARLAALLATLVAAAGCAAAPVPSPFERCVTLVAGGNTYMPDRIRAAEWCAKLEVSPCVP